MIQIGFTKCELFQFLVYIVKTKHIDIYTFFYVRLQCVVATWQKWKIYKVFLSLQTCSCLLLQIPYVIVYP